MTKPKNEKSKASVVDVHTDRVRVKMADSAEDVVELTMLPSFPTMGEAPLHSPEPCRFAEGYRMTGRPPLVYCTSSMPPAVTTHCEQSRMLVVGVKGGNGALMGILKFADGDPRFVRTVRTSPFKKAVAFGVVVRTWFSWVGQFVVFTRKLRNWFSVAVRLTVPVKA